MCHAVGSNDRCLSTTLKVLMSQNLIVVGKSFLINLVEVFPSGWRSRMFWLVVPRFLFFSDGGVRILLYHYFFSFTKNSLDWLMIAVVHL